MNSVFQKDFSKMLKTGVYQVFLFSCPAVFPLSIFFNHSWFVCSKNFKVSKWEVRFEINKKNQKSGRHLHFNTSSPFIGTSIIPYVRNFFLWRPRLVKYVEGGSSSLAGKMYDFIENSGNNYKYRDEYWAIGPNCNTYAQWVLDEFPEFDVKLSGRFIGKNIK